MIGTALVAGGVASVSALGAAPRLRQLAQPADKVIPWLAPVFAFAAAAGLCLLARGPIEVVAFALVGLTGAVLTAIDLAVHRLPDRLVLPLYPVLAGLFVASTVMTGDWGRLGRCLLAGLILAAGFFLLAVISPDGIGLGDVKFAGALGIFLGWLGWHQVLTGVLFAFVLNGVVSAVMMATGRRRTDTAFGPWLMLGALAGAWLGPTVMAWIL